MTALSEAFGVSRPTIYAASGAANKVLAQHFEDLIPLIYPGVCVSFASFAPLRFY